MRPANAYTRERSRIEGRLSRRADGRWRLERWDREDRRWVWVGDYASRDEAMAVVRAPWSAD